MSRGALAFATVACLLVAGCVGGPAGGENPTEVRPTASATPPPTSTTTSASATTTRTTDEPTYGTQFVSVSKYENQTIGTTWPEDERSTFENLTDAQRDVFLRALEDGGQRFGPDESNPFSWHDDGRPKAVRYRGEWYFVRVVIV